MTIRLNPVAPQNHILAAGIIAEGRRAAGYSFEDLAIASGLTIAEIQAIEHGTDIDEKRIRRVASVLRLPTQTL